MSALTDALGFVGSAVSAPGDYTRGLLAGKPGERMGGRDLLRHYGLAGEDDNWGNFLGGMATDVATDPLTYATAFMGGTGGASAMLGKLGPRFAGGASKLADAVAAGGRPAEMAASLMENPMSKRLLGEIPEGASLLEGSNNALSFKTPAGDVLRLTPGKGGAAPASRAAIPEMAQPTRNVPLGDWRAERVPWVDNVGDRDLFGASYKELADSIRGAGGHPADLHPGNVGGVPGRPMIIDPGAVVPHPRAASPMPLAMDALGSAPLKYRAAAAGGGAGSNYLLQALLGRGQ